MENLPSSPPPPPYKSPSPAHQAAMGLVQMPVTINHSGEGSTEALGHERQSRARQHSQTTATPPTPRLGAQQTGSHSTLSNNSSHSIGRSTHHTQSFSGGSPMNSNAGSATGSPHTPIRARSLKEENYSPDKQQSPPFIPKRGEHRRGGRDVLSEQREREHAMRLGRDNAVPIAIDPSALQKEELTIAPHNFLNRSSSPTYDKLESKSTSYTIYKDIVCPFPCNS